VYVEDVIWDEDNVEHLATHQVRPEEVEDAIWDDPWDEMTMTSIAEMTRAQEAEFWETHDATDYLDEMEPVTVTVGPGPQNRCSVCGRTLLSRYVDVDLADGRVKLRGLRQLYCPVGHETRLAPEAQRLANAVEAVLRLTLVPVGAGQRAQVAV